MRPGQADLRWSPRDAAADRVLREHVGTWFPGPVTVGRHCPQCASDAHGRPWARAGSRDVGVSLSRAGSFLVTALVGGAAVGVDLERIEAAWPLAAMLAPGERCADQAAAARLWAAKEAILKLRGVGLEVPMTEVVVADFGGTLEFLPAPPGFVLALASGGE